jgi:hypothetical protein
VTPTSHASGQLTIQAAVDRVLATGGTVCLHTGQYLLQTPVRIAGAKSIRIHGQGPASLLLAPQGAFSIEQSAAIAIEGLAIIGSAQRSAISVNTVLGLSLRELVIALFGNADRPGAGIALGGLVAGAAIRDNLIIGPEGISALDTPANEGAAQFLLSMALRIEDNALICGTSGVKLVGPVLHLADTAITGNQVQGCRAVGLAALGFAGPGASMRFTGNLLSVNGPGIACAVDGAWIEGNKLTGQALGQRAVSGSGIVLGTGLDVNGSNECQLLANQIKGYPDAGILVDAPAQSLIIKLNIIEHCGNGIVMSDASSAGALAIENNQLRDIGAPVAASGKFADAVVGISVLRAATATVAGNTLRGIGLQPGPGVRLVAGVRAFATQTVRVVGNDIAAVGPVADYTQPVAGILVIPPNGQAQVLHNRVERDATPNSGSSRTAWTALLIGTPAADPQRTIDRVGRYTLVQIDSARLLQFAGKHAFIAPGAAAVAGATVVGAGANAAAAAASDAVSVLGNVLAGRGTAPLVAITAREVIFSDNRSDLRGQDSKVNVATATTLLIANGNRIQGGEFALLVSNRNAAVAAIGNITTGLISAPLKPEMAALNLNA